VTNWPEKVATDLATTFENVPVYSNVDPNREYSGGKTIELNVQNVESIATISGAIEYVYQLVAACRAPSYTDALDLVKAVADELDLLFSSYVRNGDAVDAYRGLVEVTADSRGLVDGESFYGLLNFAIQEIERA
jgi:hypothetical protein